MWQRGGNVGAQEKAGSVFRSSVGTLMKFGRCHVALCFAFRNAKIETANLGGKTGINETTDLSGPHKYRIFWSFFGANCFPCSCKSTTAILIPVVLMPGVLISDFLISDFWVHTNDRSLRAFVAK